MGTLEGALFDDLSDFVLDVLAYLLQRDVDVLGGIIGHPPAAAFLEVVSLWQKIAHHVTTLPSSCLRLHQLEPNHAVRTKNDANNVITHIVRIKYVI